MLPRRRSERGNALLIAMIIMIVLVIIVPALVNYVTNESRETVKQKKSTTAYFIAEAAIDRGFWKMKERTSYWTDLSTGAIAGYNFDQVYSDIPSSGTASLGTYIIKLSSYSLFGTPVTTDQRVITASGRDKDKKETRTIELIIQKPAGLNSAIMAAGVTLTGGGQVHWGPMESLGSISLSGAAVVRFPRKYARLGISPSPPFDNNPAEPNYDTDGPNPHTEFWSYNEPPGVPNPPTIDLAFYKNLAQFSTAAVAAGYPGGGIYYSSDASISNAKDASPVVRYGEGKLKFQGCVETVGVTIAMGILDYSGGPCNVGQAAAGHYPVTVNIPSGAWQEYTKIDTAASGEYPGDIGGPGQPGLSATYKFGAASNSSTQTTQTISHQGFAYTAATFNASGGTVVVGTVFAPNDPGGGSGGCTIYYQDNLNIQGASGGDFTRSTWHQKAPYWPSSLP